MPMAINAFWAAQRRNDQICTVHSFDITLHIVLARIADLIFAIFDLTSSDVRILVASSSFRS
jgi:hypothetical protein